jgi:hypothetical protein
MAAVPRQAIGNAPREGQGDDRTRGTPSWPLDPGLLRTLYLDLLGRPPLSAERALWAGSRAHEWIEATLGSEESWEAWLSEQLWYFLLVDNFRPANEAVVEIPRKLAEGRLNVREALHRIALSPSFDLRNPGADTFVTVVMEQLGGMTVQKNTSELEIGKVAYDGGQGLFLGERASSQSDVVRIVIESKGAARHFLTREHRRFTRRDPDKRELADMVRDFDKDPRVYIQQVRGWLFSTAYQQRLTEDAPVSNRLFVRSLFVDLFDRLPKPDEAEPLRRALDGLADSRPLRSVLVRILLDSGRAGLPAKQEIPDATQWIAERFRRLLGREPTQDELAGFARAFQEPDCRPETILYALLSSTEYHRY